MASAEQVGGQVIQAMTLAEDGAVRLRANAERHEEVLRMTGAMMGNLGLVLRHLEDAEERWGVSKRSACEAVDLFADSARQLEVVGDGSKNEDLTAAGECMRRAAGDYSYCWDAAAAFGHAETEMQSVRATLGTVMRKVAELQQYVHFTNQHEQVQALGYVNEAREHAVGYTHTIGRTT
jgi:hypothetical protein